LSFKYSLTVDGKDIPGFNHPKGGKKHAGDTTGPDGMNIKVIEVIRNYDPSDDNLHTSEPPVRGARRSSFGGDAGPIIGSSFFYDGDGDSKSSGLSQSPQASIYAASEPKGGGEANKERKMSASERKDDDMNLNQSFHQMRADAQPLEQQPLLQPSPPLSPTAERIQPSSRYDLYTPQTLPPGVAYDEVAQVYTASLQVPGGKFMNLGKFETSEEAKRAYLEGKDRYRRK
jgi:hypothetical protein